MATSRPVPDFDFPTDVDSDDYAWLVETSIGMMHDLATKHGVDALTCDLIDVHGDDIGGWCQTFAMAMVWRMRNVLDPAHYPMGA